MQYFTYISNKEKELFNNVRELEDKQEGINSHLKFFIDCSSANVYPVNRQYNDNLKIILPDNDVQHQFKKIDEMNAM